MSNLQETDDDSYISVPTTTSPNGKLSFKAVQEVYATVFRAEERLAKKFLKPADIDLGNITDLCNKLEQYLEQYTIVAISKRAVISYRSGQSDEFADWNRLRIIDRSKIDITKKVVLECDFLLSRPGQNKPRNYKIQIEIDSINGCYAKLPKDLSAGNDDAGSDFFSAIWHSKRNGTVRCSIEYTDYMIASTALTVIEKWYATIPKVDEWEKFESLQNFINYRTVEIFSNIVAVCTGLLIAFFHGHEIEKIFGVSTTICLILIGVAFFWKSVNDVSEWGLSKFMSSPPSSSICITEGDKQLIEYTKTQQNSGFRKLVTSLIGSLVTGIISNIVVAYLLK